MKTRAAHAGPRFFPRTSGSRKAPEKRQATKIAEALLFGLFVYDGFTAPGLPVEIPVSDVAALALVGVAAFRRPKRSVASVEWFVLLWISLLTYSVFASMYNDVDWFRRAFRLAVMVVLVLAIVSARIDMRSGLKGLGAGLVINVLLFYARMAPDNYGGVLTGYLGDKNVAGMYYSVGSLLVAMSTKHRRHQVLWILFGAVAVFLTESRTALAAYACALLWIALSRRLGNLPRMVLLLTLALAVHFVEKTFSQVWIFSDRIGSDLLRERIMAAALEKAAFSPWYGQGLGEAYAIIDNHRWFFHDSYLALYVEGGWVMLFVVVGLYVRTGFRVFGTAKSRDWPTLTLEATTIALLVCASKLGEVFLSLPGFLLVAYGLSNSAHRVLHSGAIKRHLMRQL